MVNENAGGIDASINAVVAPVAEALSSFIFYSIDVGGAEFPLIVAWLVAAATFFTLYFGFINIRGFPHALRLLRGDYADPDHAGEVSHFQALATAVSGTVGIGNIGGVAVVISLGGPGATFWLMLAGFLGMSTKLAECVAGVKYRREHPDGTVSGGPMYYLEHSLQERGLPWLAKPLGSFYAVAIVIGCLGIGNMFQSNQAFNQFLYMTGGETGMLADRGWLFGLAIATAVAVVIIGGLQSIARVTSKLVPFMALAYLVLGSIVVIANAERLPWAIGAIFSEAFAPQAMTGGFVGVMILGFQRAVFSNEAGIGSAAIAHSAVRTNEPATEGYVALMEPFIDTVLICTLTALVILTTIYHPDIAGAGVQGVELTSRAFASTLAWSAVPLSLIAVLFAFSTMISWSYYGLKGWTYLLGEGRWKENLFKALFCGFGALGCTMQLDAVLDFSDAMVFLIALPNILGLYLLAPTIRRELDDYRMRFTASSILPPGTAAGGKAVPQIEFQRDMAYPAARVWALLEDFGNMEWAPGVKKVELIGDGIGMTRRLHMDGMDPIDEVLESRDAATMSYSYSIPRGIPLPVTDYLASARVEALDDEHCRVHWRARCTPTDPSVSGPQLEDMLHSTYNLLLDMVDGFLRDREAR